MVTGAVGVTELLFVEATDAPTVFLATTVNVYLVPFVRPVTMRGLALPDTVWPPLEVTV